MSIKSKLKVMVVDDMSVSRGLLMQSLEEIGIQNVEYEKSGQDAFFKVCSSPVHLIISDYNMPGMSGLDLLERIRANKATHQVGFILVTGTPTAEIVSRGRNSGLNNLIKKPFTSASLKSSIEALVGPL
ncbi:response regulator [Donghicola mangrovi]|uniref:Response regulator n=1 Tax=Donghicola mangrovi TaxID=2729614 RepID=A0A850Q2B3_9RHOB|nr:response regulator [Donghicola mangrovi]NVO23133.1 response regulator [Donghicola mangrovi]